MADNTDTPLETVTDIPSTRGIRDWYLANFATFDSVSLPNGIVFGVVDGFYGYYDSNGVFHKM